MNTKPEPRLVKISRKTSESKRDAASHGFFLSSKAPIGYRKWKPCDPDDWDSRILIIDEIAGPVVAMCFEIYASGKYSFSDISEILAINGVKSWTGRSFSREAIRLMFSCRTYLGQIEYKGLVIYPGKHQALISQDLWDRVQYIREQHSANHHKS